MKRRILNWLERQIDKFKSGPFRELYNPGNWCVRYPDGKRSVWLDYRSANDLAMIFGGNVMHRNEIERKS